MTPPPPSDLNCVLMTADTVGGVWTYALELSRFLAAQGVTVVLATMGGPLPASERQVVNEMTGILLHESNFRLEWMQDPWADIAAAADWLLELERRYHPDLIHLNSYVHAALPWSAPVLVVAHSCVLSWWEAVKRCAPPPDWSRYRSAVTEGLRHADLVVAPTRAMLDCVVQHYGAPARSAVIPNGRDFFVSEKSEKKRAIFSAGRLWDEAKNAAALATIAPRLSWPVWLAGDTHRPDGEVVSLPNVTLLGRLDAAQMQQRYAQASIYALPARYEPFGLSVLEAAQARCALVLGDVASLRELWTGAAIFVPPDDERALVAALRALIADGFRRQTFSILAQTRAREYGVRRMTRDYLAAYTSLLALTAPRPTAAFSAA